MPHIALEYSNNLRIEPELKNILNGLHKLLAGTGLFNIADFKSRAVKYDNYFVGAGDSNRAFIACNVSILSGRDDETKKMLSEKVIEFLSGRIIKPAGVTEINITVQISELHRNSYKKIIE